MGLTHDTRRRRNENLNTRVGYQLLSRNSDYVYGLFVWARSPEFNLLELRETRGKEYFSYRRNNNGKFSSSF